MLKILGMIFVVASSAAVGFGFAAGVRAQAVQLQQLISALEYMKNEISYRLTPLPELFSLLSSPEGKPISTFFACCAQSMQQSPAASVQGVFLDAMQKTPQLALPQAARQTLLELSLSLGKFDTAGQMSAITLASDRLRQQLQALEARRLERCRSYETIGVCAGLALAVILL